MISFDTTMSSNFACVNLPNIIAPIPGNNFGAVACDGNSYPRAAVMGCYTDLDFRTGPGGSVIFASPPDRRLQWRTEGTVPNRRFITSYYKVGTEGRFDCSVPSPATFQIVLYETTNVIEFYIENFSCPPIYSSINSICGIQNWDFTKGVAAPGKNATQWTAHNEAFRFTPYQGGKYAGTKLLALNGSLLTNANVSYITGDSVSIAFNNICPQADTTQYLLQHQYGVCNGFYSYDTITIIKDKTVSVSANAASSCTANGSITVNTSGDIFQYALDSGAVQNNNVFANVQPGVHTIEVTGSNNGCNSLLPVTVPVPTLLTVSTIADTGICAGDTVQLSTVSDAVSFSWQPAAGLSNSSSKSPLAFPMTDTKYFVTASAGNCTAVDSVTVLINPNPIVNASDEITILAGDNARLSASVNEEVNVLWSPVTYLSNPTALNTAVIQPEQTTIYRITAININNCMSYDDVKVIVLPNCIAVKKAFTPNGDGINDTWMAYTEGNCFTNLSVQVYNRYGSLVYENKNYRNEWQGTYKNKPLPDATYYYVVKAFLVNGKAMELRGDVTILR